jgi:hypothetical protein
MSKYISDLSKNIIRSQVNDNMEELFNMEHDELAVTEKESKKPKRTYTKKAPSRGGVRAGSGRPKGSTNKITLDSLVASIDNAVGMSFEERLATNYKDAIDREDWNAVKDYDKAFLSKIVADKQEVDMTSNGQTMNVGFTFPSIELSEWKQE